MNKINLAEKLDQVTETWSPRLVAELNGQHVKLAKLEGEFIWHRHDEEDEFFLVLSGCLQLEFRDRTITLEAGECLVVPRGVEHRPVAASETHVLLFEPVGTRNTGNIMEPRTVEHPDWV
ncbi:MAG: cupin domain-containing protein [Gemmatimonadales bacterium]|nr:MAG: cupin domain-containing protein [Gemmatimonadales bacterium]